MKKAILYQLLLIIHLMITPQHLHADSLSVCFTEKTSVKKLVSSLYEDLVHAVKVGHDFQMRLFKAWWEEWKKYSDSQDRLMQLTNRGLSITEAYKILEKEGLAEYLSLQAGRPSPMSAKELIKFLEKSGWKTVSQRGSHIKLTNSTGQNVIVPNKSSIGTGLMHSIIKQAGFEWNGSRWILSSIK